MATRGKVFGKMETSEHTTISQSTEHHNYKALNIPIWRVFWAQRSKFPNRIVNRSGRFFRVVCRLHRNKVVCPD